MPNFRHGQWVKFNAPLGSEEFVAPAHKTKDGKVVGIYQRAHTDSFNEEINEHVVAIKPDGTDALFFDGTKVNRVIFVPAALELEPLLDKADLPPGRTINSDWTPRA